MSTCRLCHRRHDVSAHLREAHRLPQQGVEVVRRAVGYLILDLADGVRRGDPPGIGISTQAFILQSPRTRPYRQL